MTIYSPDPSAANRSQPFYRSDILVHRLNRPSYESTKKLNFLSINYPVFNTASLHILSDITCACMIEQEQRAVGEWRSVYCLALEGFSEEPVPDAWYRCTKLIPWIHLLISPLFTSTHRHRIHMCNTLDINTRAKQRFIDSHVAMVNLQCGFDKTTVWTINHSCPWFLILLLLDQGSILYALELFITYKINQRLLTKRRDTLLTAGKMSRPTVAILDLSCVNNLGKW